MNKTRYAILGLCAERPYSGYDLKRIVEMRFSLFWKESYGQIYPELKKMCADGLLSSRAEGARRRTTYEITEEGRAELGRWLSMDSESDLVRSEVLLKLYFSAFTDDQTKRKHLETVMERAESALAWLHGAETELASILDDDATHGHALAVARLGIANQQAQLEWAKSELTSLRKARGE